VPGTADVDERRLKPVATAFVASKNLEESKPPPGGRPQDPLAWMLREACSCTWRDETFRLNVFVSAIFKRLDLPYS
jgi:hypothetical protein